MSGFEPNIYTLNSAVQGLWVLSPAYVTTTTIDE